MKIRNTKLSKRTLALLAATALLFGGGGFAGTTLNFVPSADVKDFTDTMERVFGKGACKVLNIRPEGAAWLKC